MADISVLMHMFSNMRQHRSFLYRTYNAENDILRGFENILSQTGVYFAICFIFFLYLNSKLTSVGDKALQRNALL